MKSIVYVSPFRRGEISGGIKVCFQHVEMLRELGFEASVYSPDGYPSWFSTTAPLFNPQGGGFGSQHVVVFPEPLDQPVLMQLLAAAKGAGMKILFCQNQYYLLNKVVLEASLQGLGFSHVITVSGVAERFLRAVLRPPSLAVVPPFIDHARFAPRQKELRIASIPRKLPRPFHHIRTIFSAKYPELAGVAWDVIENRSEAEVAEAFGRAAVFLSLCNLECCPLTPLEAMASGCSVVGFHGYGGLEYATAANGRWYPNDFLEETADGLAQAIREFQSGTDDYRVRAQSGIDTARRFNRAETKQALLRTYQSILHRSTD